MAKQVAQALCAGIDDGTECFLRRGLAAMSKVFLQVGVQNRLPAAVTESGCVCPCFQSTKVPAAYFEPGRGSAGMGAIQVDDIKYALLLIVQ